MTDKVTLQAGTYIIGDPCYFTPKDKWDELLENSSYFSDYEGFYKNDAGKKVKVVAFGTESGDGSYPNNQDSNMFDVDAALIGITKKAGRQIPSGCFAYTFDLDIECFREDGTIHFGDLEIYTGEDPREEDEFEENEDEDEEFT